MGKIGFKYDGAYPNLCSGQLTIFIDENAWVFPRHCLRSGGSVSFDKNWSEHVRSGPWKITEWPEDFPEDFKNDVLTLVNDEIPYGCCGGCV